MINNREETFDVIILFTESLISRNNFVKDQHLIKLNKWSKVKLLFLIHLITLHILLTKIYARVQNYTENQNWRIENREVKSGNISIRWKKILFFLLSLIATDFSVQPCVA